MNDQEKCYISHEFVEPSRLSEKIISLLSVNWIGLFSDRRLLIFIPPLPSDWNSFWTSSRSFDRPLEVSFLLF